MAAAALMELPESIFFSILKTLNFPEISLLIFRAGTAEGVATADLVEAAALELFIATEEMVETAETPARAETVRMEVASR
jgi:hypothetical protein